MPQDNIRVLVVDDSAVVRTMISDRVAQTPGMTVCGIARNGREALAAVAAHAPQVVTLDLKLPDMDGLTVLDAILQDHPLPVIMVSALTQAGAAVTLESLDRGAVDYVAKPDAGAQSIAAFFAELMHKIRNAAGMDVGRVIASRRRAGLRPRPAPLPPQRKPAAGDCPADWALRCVALGISTGGPPALTRLLEALRPPMPPIVIVQHMPPQFTGPLAARLNSISALTVREAAHGDMLEPNLVLVAPGGKHLELRGRPPRVRAVVRDGETVSGHKPSVDVLMHSAARIYGADCLGVIMTGMGRDGADGCRAIRAAGGHVLGQDEATSDVYGMNRVAQVEGNVDQQFGLPDAAAVITRQVRRMGRRALASGTSDLS